MLSRSELFSHVLGDMQGSGYDFALVGALAVGVRSEERHTKDIDLAVSVEDEGNAKQLLRYLIQEKHYRLEKSIASQRTSEIRGATMFHAAKEHNETAIDLLFSLSGIERDVVARAERLEILPGLFVKVALCGDLIAMKILALDDARRPRDRGDIGMLLRSATREDIELADQGVRTMQKLGRGKELSKDDLAYELDQAIALYAPSLRIRRGPTLER